MLDYAPAPHYIKSLKNAVIIQASSNLRLDSHSSSDQAVILNASKLIDACDFVELSISTKRYNKLKKAHLI